MDVVLPNGVTIRGIPEGTTKEQVMQKAISAGLAKQEDFGIAPPQEEKGLIERANEAILSNPVGRAASEFAAGVNRGAAGIVDFAASLPNAALELAGSDMRIPSAVGALAPATAGNFMEDGIGRDIARQSGEIIPAALIAGQAVRQGAAALPSMGRASESVGAGVLRQMGSSTPMQDVAGAALSAGGSVLGGEAGEEIGGDTGRQIGSFVGSVAAPVAGAVASQAPAAIASRVAKSKEASLIKEAAPTIDKLKDSAREVYKEIDDLGAVVNSGRINGLVRDLNASVRNEGFNRRIHPKVSAALREISTNADKNLKVTDVDILRKVARSAAASIEPDEARIGNIMVSKIDDFMDNIGPEDLVGGQSANVGEKYRHARQLWQRARKAEDIEFIFDKAKNQASGFENGLRTQFRSLLNNKKKIKGYTKEEIEAMQKVVRGGGVENVAKALGKFGFSEGQATSMLLGSLGVAGGAAVGGPAGGVAVPLVGQVSKNLAQKLTRNNAEFVSQLVRSGKNSTAITKNYISMVPASERSPYELTELLLTMGATDPIKYAPKSEQMKSFVSDVSMLIGAAKSQSSKEEDQ